MENLAIKQGGYVLKAMGNNKRLHILFVLKNGEICVGDLEKIVGLSQSALSQHLAILRKYNLVKTRRKSQTIYYSIKSNVVLKILGLLDKIYNSRYSVC